MIKKRNETVDIIRGIAMIMVILGHSMGGGNAEKTILYNIIWSLQMPLFILISGYVTRYNAPVNSVPLFLHSIKKRTMAYLMPYAVWTFFIRGVILNQKEFLNIGYLLWHMDTGYWFLVALWMICIIHISAVFFTEKIKKCDNDFWKIAFTGVFYLFGVAALLVIGKIQGIAFLGIKYAIYYIPFYFLGYIFGYLQDTIYSWAYGKKIIEVTAAGALFVWLYIIFHTTLYYIGDSVCEILIRFIGSLTGSIGVCYAVNKFEASQRIKTAIRWYGVHSLEVYTGHYLFLNLVHANSLVEFQTLYGFALVIVNCALTLSLIWLFVTIVNDNRYIKLVAWGKK